MLQSRWHSRDVQPFKSLRETRDVLLQELKACNMKLRDAEADVAAGVERGRARAKSEQVQTSARLGAFYSLDASVCDD